jgi:uncharacterized protein
MIQGMLSRTTGVGALADRSGSTPLVEKPRRSLFAAWLLVFYAAWIAIVIAGGFLPVVRAHWPIGSVMAAGSFVGGSTPVAGGTVGFRVLVYLFDHPISLGRNFCLAIQSVGMVSASIYIVSRRRRVEWRILRYALAGAAVSVPAAMYCLAPRVSDVWVKIVFSVAYASFGVLHLARMPEIVANVGPSRTQFAADPAIGIAVGMLGGMLAAVIGVGADILLYGTLVLLYLSDIKVAIPSAVLLMAFTSLVATACAGVGMIWLPASRSPILDVFPYWLAAAGVVALGGPLGSLVSRFVPRRSLLSFVAVLCLAQFGWTCWHEHIAGWSLGLWSLGVLAANLGLHTLFDLGRRSLPM